MNILIASATWMEVKMLADEMHFIKDKQDNLTSYELSGNTVDLLITGIGTTSATFHLTNVLNNNKYDLVINAGIAGSLNPGLEIGEIVNVVTEEFADLGIEKRENFLTLFEAGFINENEFPFSNGILRATAVNWLNDLKQVHGITTNRSHGNSNSINEIQKKFGADTETMEGAAVFYVCINMKAPCCEIRAISNYVEPRNFSDWDIPLALENLKNRSLSIINDIKANYKIPNTL